MPDDLIPEESEEQYKKLIPLLRRGFHEPVAISSSERTQMIAQVRERLMQAGYISSLDEKETFQQPGQITSRPRAGEYSRKRRIPRFINVLAAALVIGLLIGTSLLLFRPRPHSTGAPPVTATPGPTTRMHANGLEATIHLVTPGPYFLSELLLVDVSLTNHTRTLLTLSGINKTSSLCFSPAITAQMTGEGTPSYTLPSLDGICSQPAFITHVASGQTLTIRQYMPVTKSGEVTITMGESRDYPPSNLLSGLWPSLHIQVDPKVPSGRMISLRSQGTQVVIQAPQAALAHLLYMQSMSCDNNMMGSQDWTPLTNSVLSRPACPTAHKRWEYIISSPGYGIVAGKQSS